MPLQRKLAAIVFADIAGFSRQVSMDETKGLEHRRRVEQLIKAGAAQHVGRVVKTIGDAVMLEFASAVEAVSCALDIQKQMTEWNAEQPLAAPVQVRIGVHVGDVVEEDNDLYGNAVNLAQRVQTIAQPGGICISREVYVQIRPILKLRFEPVNREPEKAMPEPLEVFQVTGPAANGDSTFFTRAASRSEPPASESFVRDLHHFEGDLHRHLSRSWQIVRAHFGLMLGGTFLVLIAWGGPASTPIVGIALSLLLVGPLKAGAGMLFLKALRGQKPEFRDLFRGFGPRFLSLVIAGIFSDFAFGCGLWAALRARTLFLKLGPENINFVIALLIVALLPAIYVFVSWYFACLLVLDKGLDFWTALEASRKVAAQQWGRLFAFLGLCFLIGIGGMLVFFFGALVTIPLAFGATVCAYEETFGTPPVKKA